jgi:hypothetical protein
MKQITLVLILFPFFMMGQGLKLKDTEDFTISVISDPRASFNEKGLFIGGEIEYSGALYTRIGVSNFAALKDGYTEVIGGIGVNFSSGYFEKLRYYTGIRLGVIKRQSVNATAGIEAGMDFMINDNLFIGIRATYDYRSDFKFYDYPNEMRGSGFIRIGTKF